MRFVRATFYFLGRVLGDLFSVSTGSVLPRMGRRGMGRGFGQIIDMFF